jgi:toluene monooxygenase system protein E
MGACRVNTFEVQVPLREWYSRYQLDSPFVCSDWEYFHDPRETTYTKYTAIQSTQEVFVDGLFELIEKSDYDTKLPEYWLAELEQVMAPLRYPVHGLQMIAAYIGQMAPASRITIAAMFQAADEIRRTQRIAYRIRQLQLVYPGFSANSQALWQSDPIWQPLRETVERLLVTYDWGESFIALNLVLKPLFDELTLEHFGGLAKDNGDYLLQELFVSLNQDCIWHRQWSQALIQTALKDQRENKRVIEGWMAKWYPLALRAVQGFQPVFDRRSGVVNKHSFKDVNDRLNSSYRQYLDQLGLNLPVSDDLARKTNINFRE